jgi:hypothetical protein
MLDCLIIKITLKTFVRNFYIKIKDNMYFKGSSSKWIINKKLFL